MACDFWQLTANVSGELVERGNPSSLFYEGWDWPADGEFEEVTKWSDLNIAQPVLFNFYHGVELSLKALLVAKDVSIQTNHRLSGLLEEVQNHYDENAANEFYSKYIVQERLPDILSAFCNETGMTMDLYFQSLKYPTSTKNQKFNHAVLRCNVKKGIQLFSDIKKDIENFRTLFMDLVKHEYEIA